MPFLRKQGSRVSLIPDEQIPEKIIAIEAAEIAENNAMQ